MPALCIIPKRALKDRALTPSALKALLAIGTFTSRDGGGVWAANATLAEEADLDERNFRRALRTLVERGYVVREERPGLTSVLRIVLDEPPPGARGAAVDAPRVTDTPGESDPGGEIRPGSESPGGEGEIRPGGEGESRPPNDPVNGPGNGPTTRRRHGRARTRDGQGAPAAPPAAPLAERFAEPHHRAAYERLRRSAQAPAALDHEIALRAEGGTRLGSGRAVPGLGWAVVGEALHQLSLAGGRVTARALEGFIRGVVEARPETTPVPAVRPEAAAEARAQRAAAALWERVVATLSARDVSALPWREQLAAIGRSFGDPVAAELVPLEAAIRAGQWPAARRAFLTARGFPGAAPAAAPPLVRRPGNAPEPLAEALARVVPTAAAAGVAAGAASA